MASSGIGVGVGVGLDAQKAATAGGGAATSYILTRASDTLVTRVADKLTNR